MGVPKLITVSGTIRTASGTQGGWLVWASDTLVRDNATDDVMLPHEIVVTVPSTGEFTVQIPCNDDPGFSPSGWTWEVRPHFPGWRTPFSVSVPFASPGDAAEFSDLVEIPPDGDGQLYALFNHTHAGGGGGSLVGASTVASQTTYGATSTAGAAATYSKGDHAHGTPALPTAADVGASATGHNHSGTYDAAGTASSLVAALTKVLVLGPATAIPGGTAAGTVIVRTAT
jgi:hypothetical protein